MFERCTNEVRIDKTDASFVDIIHTNGGNEDAGFLGINSAVGHADFFPNGGHNQPGCNNFICSHGEATWMYVDSIGNRNGGCTMNKCSSESDYNNGRCNSCSGSDCNTMGWGSSKPRSNTKYYGDTRSSSPYC